MNASSPIARSRGWWAADRPSRGGSIPAGLLGMVLLVVAIESAIARHTLDFSDPVSLNWRLAAEDARTSAPGASILCVGDSLVKHSVIPRLVEARTGRSTCNLGLARGPAPATYFMLRRALDAGARPSAVVVDFKPSVLVGSPRYNLRYWQEIASPGECLDLADAAGHSLLTEILVGRILPSYRGRHEARGALLAALRGEENPIRRTNRVCRRNWSVNDGANVATHSGAFTGEVSPEQHKTLLSSLWYCHRANRIYIDRLLDLTARRGIPVYWLLPPISPQLQARREESGAEAGYLRFVRAFQARYPHLTIIDGRHARYGHDVFVDATHLDGQGASVLSVELADLLNRDLSGARPPGRWLPLPDYRDRPPALVLEDVGQSERIVKAESASGPRKTW